MTDDLALRELPMELSAAVERELAGDERLVWIGRPDAGRAALRTLPIMLFAIPWTAFSVFWMAAAGGLVFDAHPPHGAEGWGRGAFALFGLPFVLIGLAMLSSPYWAWRKQGRSAYLITTKRAVILVAGRSTAVRSFGRGQLQVLARTERADGSGDIVIQPEGAPGDVMMDRQFGSNRTRGVPAIGFFGIPDVKRVEDLLRQVP